MESVAFKPTMFFHPGETLKEKMDEMGLTAEQVAAESELPNGIVKAILDGTYSVSADIALAFEHTTQIPASYWLKAQHAYDDYILKTQPATYKSRLASLRRVAAVLL